MKLGVNQQMQQQMKLSPQMIQTISLMALPTTELRERIYEEVEKNPALEIINDNTEVATLDKTRTEVFVGEKRKTLSLSGVGRVKSSSTGNSEESDNFQSFLENRPDKEETLQSHLLSQVRLMPLTETEHRLTEKIIANLDDRGFHHVSPEGLLDAAFPDETPELLNRCLNIVRRLDPVGTGCYGVQESLLVQAQLAGEAAGNSNTGATKTDGATVRNAGIEKLDNRKAPPLALLILAHHFRLLENPRPSTVYKKLASLPPVMVKGVTITLEKVTEALDFIKTLDPQPARQFSSSSTVYVAADVIIRKIPIEPDETDVNEELYNSSLPAKKNYRLQAEFEDNQLPDVIVSPVFSRLASKAKSMMGDSELKFVTDAIKDAQWFLGAIEQRKATMLKVIRVILRRQAAFFDMGPRYLSPLRMKDVAEEIGVHETTVSRIANGKYLRCEWGFFELKYFFTNASGGEGAVHITGQIGKSKSSLMKQTDAKLQQTDVKTVKIDIPASVSTLVTDKPLLQPKQLMTNDGTPLVAGGSKESVKQELKILIEQQTKLNPQKRISDEKLSKLLAEKGIVIARRTVAKYRAELQINSSYDR